MTAAALARFAAEALAALQDRDHDPHEAEERAAIFAGDNLPAYDPSAPDALRDGLAAGYRAHQRKRAALPDDVERAALLGWRLVPATRTKKGMFAGFIDAATSDLAQLEAWAAQYPGCCWKCIPLGSGVWFLDVDVPGAEHKHDGRETLAALIATHGPLPATPEAVSPSGGRLLVFRDTGAPISAGSGKVGAGLDTLAGRVAPMVPPSERKGGAYRWVTPPWQVAPPVAPDWLLRLVAPPPEPPRPAKPVIATPDHARRSLARAINKIAAAGPGQRNTTVNGQSFKVARWIGAGLLDEAEAVRALYAAALSIGLPAVEARNTIKSGCLAGYRQPIELSAANA